MADDSSSGAEWQISLAEWSLNRSLESGLLSNLDFPRVAREDFGIDTIELVNTLMEGPEVGFVRELDQRARDCGVRVLLLMCDDEGDLCAVDADERLTAAKNHHKWLEAARALGARAIRVNTGPENAAADGEAVRRCAESCRSILDYAEKLDLQVLIENHGGLSFDMDLLDELLRRVDHPLFGTLPDFGNFPPDIDRYDAVRRMMPHAKSVSAKCFDFDDETGEEVTFDLVRMLDLVRDSGYRGYLGIEYEGDRLDEYEGIRRAKRALQRWIEGN